MKANELRIGNWVNLNDGSLTDDYRVVEKVGRKNVEFIIKGCNKVMSSRPISDVYGIPLTEEILLKCGFDLLPNGKLNHDNLCKFEINFIFNSKSHLVKYLHQVQNLYFELTGKELDIKLMKE